MDILFICIQSLTFFPADSKTVTNSWNTAAKMTAEFSDNVLLSVGCVFIVLFCFVFLFLWLFYFSTLAMIDCLIEDKCRALLSQSLGSFPCRCGWGHLPLGWFSVSVALCALLLLSLSCSLLTCHDAAPQTPHHVFTRTVRWSPRPHLSVSTAVMGFSTFLLVFFWELALKIQSPVVFLWCSFRSLFYMLL